MTAFYNADTKINVKVHDNCTPLIALLLLKIIHSKSRALTSKKIFAKLKFSPALFEKIPSFVCLVFKIENK